MAKFKEGDRVRRTQANQSGTVEAGYEFTVGTVRGGLVYEKDSGISHLAEYLERVAPAPVNIAEYGGTGTGEVRTTSASGGEKGVKPEEYALIPWEAMDEIARVYAFGAQKYAAHNWRKGYEWSKSFSALSRHIFAFWKGEDRDPESGLSHLAHAGFHVLSMLTFWLDKDRYGTYDDRYKA